MQELAARCNSIFTCAAQAAARSAIVTHPLSLATPVPEGSKANFVRERLVADSEVRPLLSGCRGTLTSGMGVICSMNRLAAFCNTLPSIHLR